MKKFDYQLTPEDCQPSQGYTNKIYILHKKGLKPATSPKSVAGDLGEWTEHEDIDMADEGDVE